MDISQAILERCFPDGKWLARANSEVYASCRCAEQGRTAQWAGRLLSHTNSKFGHKIPMATLLEILSDSTAGWTRHAPATDAAIEALTANCDFVLPEEYLSFLR
jgi:hypothetical protein